MNDASGFKGHVYWYIMSIHWSQCGSICYMFWCVYTSKLVCLLVDNVNTLIRSQCGSICYMVWCVYTGGFTMKHLDLWGRRGSIISTCTVLKVEKSHLHVEGPLFFAQLKNKSISHFGKWRGGVSWLYCWQSIKTMYAKV